MDTQPQWIIVSPREMHDVFKQVLTKYGFGQSQAEQCAAIFTGSSIDGVYTHGVNRFATFIDHVKKGYVKKDAEPTLKHKAGAIEQWDGHLGPGPLNAIAATDRAIELSTEYGLGCVALSQTNHWMRGGTYGWHAAKRGFVFIGFTNTIANMPAWGAVDRKLGNNPLVIALPFNDEAIVMDMAMSQYSFGALQQAVMKKENMAVNAGFGNRGEITNDPSAVIASGRMLPAGYWKGAGLALLLDMLAVVLSGGLATHEISSRGTEYGLSQVFIAIDISKVGAHSAITTAIGRIVDDYLQSTPADAQGKVIYPGERVLETRKRNTAQGIPVIRTVWEEILAL